MTTEFMYIYMCLLRCFSSRRYNLDAELVWCQEEPKNMGFWTFVQPRVNTAVRELLYDDTSSSSSSSSLGGGDESSSRSREVRYVGRPAAASPATG